MHRVASLHPLKHKHIKEAKAAVLEVLLPHTDSHTDSMLPDKQAIIVGRHVQ